MKERSWARMAVSSTFGVALALALAAPAVGGDGDLDSTYATGGETLTLLGSGASVAGLSQGPTAVQVAGTVTVGGATQIGLVGISSAGAAGAPVTTPVPGASNVQVGGVLASPLNPLVYVVGSATVSGVPNLFVARYSGGSLDTGFDGDGFAFVPRAGTTNLVGTGLTDVGGDLAISGYGAVSGATHGYVARLSESNGAQIGGVEDLGADTTARGVGSDGTKLYVAGSTRVLGRDQALVERRTISNGGSPSMPLDAGYGTGGRTVVPSDSVARAIDVEISGVAAVAGDITDSGGTKALVAKLTSGGGLDTSFSGDGVVAEAVDSPSNAHANAIDLDVGANKVLIAGTAKSGGRDYALAARYVAGTGAFDPAFTHGPIPTALPVVHGMGDGRQTRAAGVLLSGSASLLAVDALTQTGRQIGIAKLDTNANRTPDARINGPTSVYAGESHNFNSFASTAFGSISAYDWDFTSDGGVDATGSSAGHTYSTPGTEIAAVRVTGPGSLREWTSYEVAVLANHAPVADFTVPSSPPTQNATVNLCGTPSSDPDGHGIDLYEWDFDSDGTVDKTTSSVCVQTSFNGDGAKKAAAKVTLRVRDNLGAFSNPVTKTFALKGIAPTVVAFKFVGDAKRPLGSTFGLATAVDDADAGTLTYQYDFTSDGFFDQTVTADGPTQGTSVLFTPKKIGIYTAKVRITDEDGLVAEATQGYQVLEPLGVGIHIGFPPKSPILPKDTVYLSPTKAKGYIGFYAWDLDGDGTYETPSTSAGVEKKFPKPGNYPIGLKVSSDDGKYTATASATVPVVSLPPTAEWKIHLAKVTNGVIEVQAKRVLGVMLTKASHPAADRGHYIASYEWFLDGAAKPFGTGYAPKLTIPTVGKHVVTLRLTDDIGQQANIAHTVVATAPKKPTAFFTIVDKSKYIDDDGLPVFRPGKVVKLNSNGSVAAPGTLDPKLEYVWQFNAKGDGSAAENPKLQLVPEGDRTITLTVTDSDGQSAKFSRKIHVRPNIPPVADILITPDQPLYGDPLNASSYGSHDPDGAISSRNWGFISSDGFQSFNDPGNVRWLKADVGKQQIALQVTDDEGATDLAHVIVEVGPPPCRSFYDGTAWHVVMENPDAGCIRVYHNGQCKSTKADCDYLEMSGSPFTLNGLTVDPQDKLVTALDFLGHKMVAQAAGAGVPDYLGEIQAPKDAKVAKGAFQMVDGTFHWALGKDRLLDGFQYTGKNTIGGLPVAGTLMPKLLPDLSIDLPYAMKLPDELGGGISDILPLDQAGSLNPQLLDNLTAEGASLVGDFLPLKKLDFHFVDAGTFSIDAEAELPPPIPFGVDGSVALSGGKFQSANIVLPATAGGLPIGNSGVFLNEIHFGVNASSGTSFTGGAKFTVGPGFDGNKAIAAFGADVQLDFPDSGPWHVGGKGDLSVLAIPIGHAHFDYYSNNYVVAGGDFGYHPFEDVGFDGSVGIELLYPQFNVSGSGNACAIGYCLGATGLISDIGGAFCMKIHIPIIGDWHPGFGITYHPFDVDLFEGGCDIGDYKSVIAKPASAARAFGAGPLGERPMSRAVTKKAFKVGKGVPGTIVRATGATAPPKLTLVGPKGERIDTPVGSTKPLETKDAIVLQNARAKETVILLKGPSAGTWSATADGMTALRTSDGLPKLNIDAKVTGSDLDRTLQYKVAPQPGQKVTFLEVADKAGAKVAARGPRAAVRPHVLARIAAGSAGARGFTPAPGPAGKRSIVAIVSNNGRPRERVVVASYKAPEPDLPSKPKLTETRKGTTLTVSWPKQAGVRRWVAHVVFPDGRRALKILDAGTRTLTFERVSRTATVKVDVMAVDANGFRGPVAREKSAAVRKLSKIVRPPFKSGRIKPPKPPPLGVVQD